MKKRILGLISAGILSATMIACGATEPQTETKVESSNGETAEVSEGSETAENNENIEIFEDKSDSSEVQESEEKEGPDIITVDGYKTQIVIYHDEKDEDAYLNGQDIAFEYAVNRFNEMGLDGSQVKKLTDEQLEKCWNEKNISTAHSWDIYPRSDYLYMTKDWQVVSGWACQYEFVCRDEAHDDHRMIVAYDNTTGLVFESTQLFVDVVMHSLLFATYGDSKPIYLPTFGYPNDFYGASGYMEEGCDIENMLDFLAVVHKNSGSDRYFIMFDYPGLEESAKIMDVDKIYEAIDIIEKFAVSKEECEYDGSDRIYREFYLK